MRISIISKKAVSILIGIFLSIIVRVSINFPPLSSDLPLAAVDAVPQNGFAVVMNYMRIALDAGYGIETTVIAFVFAYIIYRFADKWSWGIRRYGGSLVVLSILFGCINVAGLCMYWLDCLPMFSSGIWMLGGVFLAGGWAMLFYALSSIFLYILDRNVLIQKPNEIISLSTYRLWMENNLFLVSFCAYFLRCCFQGFWLFDIKA